MKPIGSMFRLFFAAIALAVFALPASAAQPSKQYSLDLQLSGSVQYWNDLGQPPPGGNVTGIAIPPGGTVVFATITNQTSTGGNSAINSFVFASPAGWTISGPYGKPAGVVMDDTSAPGKLKVSNITGLQPKDVQGTHAITISFVLKPNSCTTASVNWVNYLTVTTGTFSNTTFAWVPLTDTNQITKPSGCGFTVSKTYDVAPATGTGAVTVTLSCASGSVSPASASVAPGTPATFIVSGFSSNPNCTATESPIPTGYDVNSTGTCSAALLTGACTVANLVNRYTLTYNANPSTGGSITGATSQTNVPYGGSGTAVTAVANSGWRFVQWSDSKTTASRTDTNVQANVAVTAQFGGTLSFTTPPHDAVVGNQIGPVVVACNNFADGTPVLLTIDGAVPLAGTTTVNCSGGSATFNNVATVAPTTTVAGTTPGLHTFTATASDGGPASTSATATANATLTASSGVLWCTESGDGPSGSQVDFGSPDPAVTLSGTRYPNKDGSPCIAVNFSVQVETTATAAANKVTILWDEVSQPNLTLKLNVTWPPELAGPDLLPKPTLYNIGYGTYTAGTCLKKNPAYPTDPDNPPEKIAALTSPIDDAATTIYLTPNSAWPTSYPFSIIVPGADPANPERMLVTGAVSGGGYTVVRGTGLTLKSAHATSASAMWTPLPLDNGSGTNAPAGGQDQVCSISDTYAAYAPSASTDPVCPAQPAGQEPLPCMRATQKLWTIGDVFIARD